METVSYKIVKTAATEEIIDLYKDAGWWNNTAEEEKRIPAIINKSFCFIVAIYSNKIIGMGRVISDGISDAYIQDVVVKKEFRGKGIGYRIIEELTKYCKKYDLEWIGLIAEPNTTNFYLKLGFKELKNYQPMLLKND